MATVGFGVVLLVVVVVSGLCVVAASVVQMICMPSLALAHERVLPFTN